MQDVADHRYGLYLHELYREVVPSSADFRIAFAAIEACSPARTAFPVALWRERTLWFCYGFAEQGANSEYVFSTRVKHDRIRGGITVDARHAAWPAQHTKGMKAAVSFGRRPRVEQEDILTGYLRAMASADADSHKRVLLRLFRLYA